MRKRTAARVLAIQALYQLDLRGETWREELEAFLKSSSKDEEVRLHAEELVEGIRARRDEIDAALTGAAEHWDISRMAALDRAILRLGAHELLHRPEVPPKVAIDEAVRLAKKFSTAESGAFVNGILDRVMSTHLPPAAKGQGRAL